MVRRFVAGALTAGIALGLLAFAAPRPDIKESIRPGMTASASVIANATIEEHLSAPWVAYRIECIGDCGGTGGWQEIIHNLVTNEGRDDVLNKYFKGSAYTAAWYLGLKGTGSAAAGDTLASHTGWSEMTPYAGNRPAITWGTTSGQSNTATAVSYSINASATVAGAFIASVNTGTAGILYSAGDFAQSRSVVSGDTLNATPTVTD